MNLEKAIKTIKNLKSLRWFSYAGDRGKKILSDEEDEAIDTVLNELQILKKENDTLWEENIKLKQLNIAYKLRINDFTIDIHKAHTEGYQDGYNQGYLAGTMESI